MTPNVAMVAAIGDGAISKPGMAAKFFQALSDTPFLLFAQVLSTLLHIFHSVFSLYALLSVLPSVLLPVILSVFPLLKMNCCILLGIRRP